MSVSRLSPEQIAEYKTKLESHRIAVKKPKPLTRAQTLARLNSALTLAKIPRQIYTAPTPMVTLTPASPRSPNGKSMIELLTYASVAEWVSGQDLETHPPEGFIQLPHAPMNDIYAAMQDTIGFWFETVPGNIYVVEIQTQVSSPSPTAFWEIWNVTDHSTSTLSANTSPIIVAFTARVQATELHLTYYPNASAGQPVRDTPIFFGCKLMLVE